MIKKLIIISVLVFISSVPLCLATEYTVRTPSEIKEQMSIAQPGDTLTMANGVWTDAEIVFEGQAAEGSPILLRAETPGYVIITGESNLRIAGTYLIVDGLYFLNGITPSGGIIEFRNNSRKAYHCRLTNTAIVNYNPPDKNDGYKWVSLYGSHNRVDHCFLSGKTNSGATLVVWMNDEPDYHIIDHNYFGFRPPLGENGAETIRVGTSDWSMYNSRTTVEYNYFEHCNGEVEIISSKSCENIYRYNTFYECEGTLTLRHGNRCTVESNYFIGNQKPLTGGVRVIGEDHKVYNNYFCGLYGDGFNSALPIMNGVPNSPLNRYFQVKNAVIAFNTFVDCKNTITIGLGADSERTLPPTDCKITNNVVLTDYQIITQDAEPVNLLWEGNIMQGSSLGIPQPPGINLTDPELIFAADSLWRPREISPVINAAEGDFPYVVDDFDGQLRNDGNPDAGCDEVSSEPIQRQPVKAGDAGPSWLRDLELPFILGASVDGPGKIDLNPAGGLYESGTMVTVTAIPNLGADFDGWSGDLSGSTNPAQILMDGNKSITATFSKPGQFTLIIWKNGSGNVVLNPQAASYMEGTKVAVKAIPDNGWVFDSWGSALNGSTNPDTVVMDADKILVANFDISTSVNDINFPGRFKLEQNFPNPVRISNQTNQWTIIGFILKTSGKTTIRLYDSLGRELKTLVDSNMESGHHKVRLNTSNLIPGIYFYQLVAGSYIARKKMIVVH